MSEEKVLPLSIIELKRRAYLLAAMAGVVDFGKQKRLSKLARFLTKKTKR